MVSQYAFLPQLQSGLFRCPAEIRQAIYYSHFDIPARVHVSFQESGLRLSACFKQGDGDEDVWRQYREYENKLNRKEPAEEELVRRLQSSWGPHWKCEEISLRRSCLGKNNATGLFLVCKRMYVEYFDLFVRSVEFCFMDLKAINYINTSKTTRFTALTILPGLLLSVTRLNIHLRLPLRLYKALGSEKGIAMGDRGLREDLITWMRIGSTLSQIEKLRVLHVWLDHDESCTWMVVNERAILAPLTELFNNKNIDISVSLPKLHPKFERDDCHFTSKYQAPFSLRRRVRQSIHVLEDRHGCHKVRFKPDFPDFSDILKGEMTSEEAEEIEQLAWRGGRSIDEIVEDLIAIATPSCTLEQI